MTGNRMEATMGQEIGTAIDPIAVLKDEHRKIEIVLDGLESMASAAEAGAYPDVRGIQEILWFLREFTDVRHHAKEEELLFPVLELRGLPRESGPTSAMRHEHIQGRKLVKLLGTLLSEESSPVPDWEQVALASLAYVRLLRAHIQKENHCIFEIAGQMLGSVELDALGAAFVRVDTGWAHKHGPEAGVRLERVLQKCGFFPDRVGSEKE